MSAQQQASHRLHILAGQLTASASQSEGQGMVVPSGQAGMGGGTQAQLSLHSCSASDTQQPMLAGKVAVITGERMLLVESAMPVANGQHEKSL